MWKIRKEVVYWIPVYIATERSLTNNVEWLTFSQLLSPNEISAACFIIRLQENSGDDEEDESRILKYVHDKDALNFFGKEAHLTLDNFKEKLL